LTLTQVVEAIDARVAALGTKPVLIGHSMGGLIAQLLVAKGRAAAAVLIDSAAPTGVAYLSWSFLKSNWPIVSPFASESEPFLPSIDQFAYAFAHTLERESLVELYNSQVVPESRGVGRGPLGAQGAVDFSKPHAPLFFVSGALDHIIPPGLNVANMKKYRDPSSVREHKLYPGRTHSIIVQAGWEEVASDVEAFVLKHAAST
jgi:pimeloyl-ACP methyl ester carboxylesterase